MPKHAPTDAPGTVVTNDEDRELAALIAQDEQTKMIDARTASPGTAPGPASNLPQAGGEAPPLGGQSLPAPAGTEAVRFRGVPVIPFSLSVQPPDADGRVVLHEPQSIAALERLSDIHAVTYDAPDPNQPPDAPRRIARQYNVWLTDRRQIIQAGLIHKDRDGCWLAQTFPGTKTVYPRNMLG